MKLTIAVDYYDLVWASDELFGEEAIDKLLGEYAERGVDSVQWRVSVCGKLFYHTRLGDRFAEGPFIAADIPGIATLHQPIYEKSQAIMAKMDPLEAAVRLCRKHGLKVYPWLTIYDDAGYHPFTWSNLIRRNPEYCWKAIGEDKFYHGVTSYVYPEVVEYRLNQIGELLGYGVDGIHLCTRTHSRPPGYIEQYLEYMRTHGHDEWEKTPTGSRLREMVEDCRGRFGFDPPAVDAFHRKFGRNPRPDDTEWWKLRGDYLLDFLTKAKELVSLRNGALSFGPRAKTGMFPSGFFNWKSMLVEQLVDELHYGATNGHVGSSEARGEFPELFETPGRKNYFFSVNHKVDVEKHFKRFESSGNIQFLEQFNGITAFEAFHLILNPKLWDYIDYLRR